MSLWGMSAYIAASFLWWLLLHGALESAGIITLIGGSLALAFALAQGRQAR